MPITSAYCINENKAELQALFFPAGMIAAIGFAQHWIHDNMRTEDGKFRFFLRHSLYLAAVKSIYAIQQIGIHHRL
jgi:hypothetical protein